MTPKNELTTDEVAAMASVSRSTLERKRSNGTGMPYIKRCGKVFYRRADVLAWMEANTTEHGEVSK